MRREAGKENCLLLACGEFNDYLVGGDPEVAYRNLKTALAGYATMGCRVFAPGRREIMADLPRLLAERRSPPENSASGCRLVCGNLAGPVAQRLGIAPWVRLRRSRHVVLVTGLVAPPLPATPITAALHLATSATPIAAARRTLTPAPTTADHPQLRLTDPKTTLAKILREPHDLAIVILHLPEKEATRLLQQVPGVDLAILVDQQGILPRGKRAGTSLMLRNNDRSRSLGIVEWKWSKQKTLRTWSLRVDGRRFRPDPELEKLVNGFENWRRQYFAKKFAPVPAAAGQAPGPKSSLER